MRDGKKTKQVLRYYQGKLIQRSYPYEEYTQAIEYAPTSR